SEIFGGITSVATSAVPVRAKTAFTSGKFFKMSFSVFSCIRSDIGVKIFGDDMQVLNEQAQALAQKVQKISGATAVKVEQTSG
ncbi:hypothetical protein HN302_20195, partial [Acinetobacter baumannii]|nr:hypothetical protein [Acinetobacter baumannii]